MAKSKISDDNIVVADIIPPVIASLMKMLLNPSQPLHVRENARTTLSLIADELNRALAKSAKDFTRRT